MKRQNTLLNIGAVRSTAIAAATTYDPTGRGVYITGAGNIVGKLLEDTADRTFAGLVAGQQYALCFKSITSATATGFVLH
jgi:hypothetical protein